MGKLKLPKIPFLTAILQKIKLPKQWMDLINRWNFAKKYINVVIPLILLVAVGAVTVVFSAPALFQLVRLKQDIDTADAQTQDSQYRLDAAKLLNEEALQKKKRALTRKLSSNYSFSNNLNSLTESIRGFDIRIVSISPGAAMAAPPMEEMPTRQLMVLPVELNLQGAYKNFGEFVHGLSYLPDCLVVVEKYSLHREEEIFPRLAAQLWVKAYFLAGSSAQPESGETQAASGGTVEGGS